MAMTCRASICLSLLALLSSFPVSLGVASHISGSSLIGVNSVSEILDQFFKKQEMNGRKAPAWKVEAQSMISLVQSLKDIDPETQAKVNGWVRNITNLLQADRENLKPEQAAAKINLDRFEEIHVWDLGNLSQLLTKVKSMSGKSAACRQNVSTLKASYFGTHGCTASYLPSQIGDLSPCGNLTCGKPSTVSFELTEAAKQKETCKFQDGETAKQCVGRLWDKVNRTRETLTSKYLAWSANKTQCLAKEANCARCNELWDPILVTNETCNGKRDGLFEKYCDLQALQNDFCISNTTLHDAWNSTSNLQVERVKEYIDLTYIKCVFEKYLEVQTFNEAMIRSCQPLKTANDFYQYASDTGEITLPTVDASAVPACYGAVSHSSTSPLFDMTGLINELQYNNYATTVSVADHIYAPAAGTGSVFCAA